MFPCLSEQIDPTLLKGTITYRGFAHVSVQVSLDSNLRGGALSCVLTSLTDLRGVVDFQSV